MSDYIRRDAVIKWVESWLNMDRYFRPNGKHDEIPITELYALLKQIPSVDAVHVVRCQECEHADDYSFCDYFGYDDFCSHGESKEVQDAAN